MISMILTGVRAALAADATLTALAGGRIYSLHAPEGAALPYLILNIDSGGEKTVSPVPELDVTVRVTCIAENDATGGALIAVQAADRVRAVLHDSAPTLSGGWRAYRCQHQRVLLETKTENRTSYTFAGGTYRVRAVYAP